MTLASIPAPRLGHQVLPLFDVAETAVDDRFVHPVSFVRDRTAPSLPAPHLWLSTAGDRGRVEPALSAKREANLAAARRLAQQWSAQLLNPQAGTRGKDLAKTATPVFEALLHLGPASIDLRNLPAEQVNGMHLAVILRATLSRRASTPGWDTALGLARQALVRAGIDPEIALSGLT